jgi:hypothetical protein
MVMIRDARHVRVNELQEGSHCSAGLFKAGMVVRLVSHVLSAFETLLLILQKVDHLRDVIGISVALMLLTPRNVHRIPALAVAAHRVS